MSEPLEFPSLTGPVVAVFAHPDDADISSGGTLAKWASAGRDVHLVILTNGDRGSGDAAQDRAELAVSRAREAAASASVMGLASVRVGQTHDGELRNTPEEQERLVRIIRELQPETLLSCDPTAWFFEHRYYNHADHRIAGEIALDAIFPGSGNPHFFAEHLAEGLAAWPVSDVWLGWSLEANYREDITATMDTKLQALAKHESQVAGDQLGFFEEWLPSEAAEEGAHIGAAYAESFRRLLLE